MFWDEAATCFVLVSCLAYCYILKMEASPSSEMSVNFHWTTRLTRISQKTELLVTTGVKTSNPTFSTSFFPCSFFNDGDRNSGRIASFDWKTVNKELERMWKEAVTALFKVLQRHLSGGTEESCASFTQENGFPVPPEYQSKALPLGPPFSASFLSVLVI
jgi:hypothetical protein